MRINKFKSNILCFYIQYEQVLSKNLGSFGMSSNGNDLYIAFLRIINRGNILFLNRLKIIYF